MVDAPDPLQLRSTETKLTVEGGSLEPHSNLSQISGLHLMFDLHLVETFGPSWKVHARVIRLRSELNGDGPLRRFGAKLEAHLRPPCSGLERQKGAEHQKSRPPSHVDHRGTGRKLPVPGHEEPPVPTQRLDGGSSFGRLGRAGAGT